MEGGDNIHDVVPERPEICPNCGQWHYHAERRECCSCGEDMCIHCHYGCGAVCEQCEAD